MVVAMMATVNFNSKGASVTTTPDTRPCGGRVGPWDNVQSDGRVSSQREQIKASFGV